MKTILDLIRYLEWDEIEYSMANSNGSSDLFKKDLFMRVIKSNPHIINDFKHLLNNTELKHIIKVYPQTKLYLE